MCTRTTPLTPGCHCAPVTINHVLQSLALFEREGTNHTPHYPGLVTLKRCRPRTPQPVAVWPEKEDDSKNGKGRTSGICKILVGSHQCEQVSDNTTRKPKNSMLKSRFLWWLN